MKFIYFLILLCSFLVMSCARETECCEDLSNENLTSESAEIPVITTANEIEPIRNLPPGFILDSIIKEETEEVLFSQVVYFPKSIDDEEFNKKMKKFIEKEIELERPDSKSMENFTTSFDMWLTKIDSKDNILVCSFHLQSFTEGAAHYNHDDLTFQFSSK